jgi:hypothetical protein
VKIRQESEAVYARLETDSGVLLAAAGNSNRINDIQNGSGGVIQTHAFVIPFPNVDRRRWTIPVEVPATAATDTRSPRRTSAQPGAAGAIEDAAPSGTTATGVVAEGTTPYVGFLRCGRN